jgi:glycosyltransferase involved in cell wall biosynthesis
VSGGTRPSVCFVAPDAYPVLSGQPDLAHFGGAEVQQVRIARELVRRGWQISFITTDHGQPDGIEHDGIRVYRMCARTAGLPVLRFVHPRWTSLWSAMRRADADVYYQRGAGCETGQVALWARRHGRAFVFAAASDTNCDPSLPDLRTRRERVLYRAGLRRARQVIAQSDDQRAALKRVFGRESVVVRSCAPDPLNGAAFVRTLHATPSLLWVGRFSPKKRFEFLLELATAEPGRTFDVVGDSNEGAYARALTERARALPNVRLHGRVPPDQVRAYYDYADLVLCTSPVEGFPNTFLEAWALGIPTVSTVDPDELIVRHGLGGTGQTVDEVRRAIAGVLDDPQAWAACSGRARAYFLANHTVCVAGDAYERILDGLNAHMPAREVPA